MVIGTAGAAELHVGTVVTTTAVDLLCFVIKCTVTVDVLYTIVIYIGSVIVNIVVIVVRLRCIVPMVASLRTVRIDVLVATFTCIITVMKWDLVTGINDALVTVMVFRYADVADICSSSTCISNMSAGCSLVSDVSVRGEVCSGGVNCLFTGPKPAAGCAQTFLT